MIDDLNRAAFVATVVALVIFLGVLVYTVLSG